MKQYVAAILIALGTQTCLAAGTVEENLVAAFLDCDATVSAFIEQNRQSIDGYAKTAEVKPGFQWFRATRKNDKGDTYVAFATPMKVGTVTAVAAGYSYDEMPSFGSFEFWGLYFKEDIKTVHAALKEFRVIRDMRYMGPADEHYARLRIKTENGKKIEWVNILEPKKDGPQGAASYLSCSLQPRM